MRWIARALAAAVVLAAGMGGAQTPGAKLALVIGNAAYTEPQWVLTNPVNDANLVAQRLRPLGFEVTLLPNATKVQMDAAMGAFAARLRAGGSNVVGFFYYAGHAAELDGANHLVPVDVSARSLDELRYQAPPMNFMLRDMARLDNDVNVVVLDACRNVPLPSGTRAGPAGGLSLEELKDVPANVFIAYATRPGQVALDNETESNSIFTRILAEALASSPSERIETLFGQVQSRVFRATGEIQRPEYRNGLLRAPEFRFAQPIATQVSAVDRSELPPPPAPKKLPGETFKECDVCPEMVVIPGGTFLMGAPSENSNTSTYNAARPQTRVTIPSLAVGKFEVTFAEWDACIAGGGCVEPFEGPYRPNDQNWGRGTRPVINVSWTDAQRYISWINSRVGGKAYRLLSESEWEYAARAGTTGDFHNNGGPAELCEIANHYDRSDYTVQSRGGDQNRACSDGFRGGTAPVGRFAANAFGLHDMQGNVWEWLQDCGVDGYAGQPTDGSPRLTSPCSGRRIRGGNWTDGEFYQRLWVRKGFITTVRSDGGGFRVARVLGP